MYNVQYTYTDTDTDTDTWYKLKWHSAWHYDDRGVFNCHDPLYLEYGISITNI